MPKTSEDSFFSYFGAWNHWVPELRCGPGICLSKGYHSLFRPLSKWVSISSLILNFLDLEELLILSKDSSSWKVFSIVVSPFDLSLFYLFSNLEQTGFWLYWILHVFIANSFCSFSLSFFSFTTWFISGLASSSVYLGR